MSSEQPSVHRAADLEGELMRRFKFFRPIGYVAGFAFVCLLGIVWDSSRILVLSAQLLLLAVTSLFGRRGQEARWLLGWLAMDITSIAIFTLVLGLPDTAGALMWASHLATGFFVMTRSRAWVLAGFTAAVVVVLLLAQDLPPPEITLDRMDLIRAIFVAIGGALLVGDLDLVAGALRRVAHRREMEVEFAGRLANHRASLLRDVSHEIRNPLTGIGGFGQLLQSAELSAEERMEFADQIVVEARHLSGIVDDLLAEARLDSEQLTLDLTPVPLLNALTQAASHHVSNGMAVDLTVDANHVVRGHNVRLDQITRNILSNTAKYGGGSSRISSRRDGEFIVIRFADDGPGVPGPERERIFEDFRQVGAASQATGSGLGLGISRRLARAMGGDLRCVDSEQGAVFELLLPAQT